MPVLVRRILRHAFFLPLPSSFCIMFLVTRKQKGERTQSLAKIALSPHDTHLGCKQVRAGSCPNNGCLLVSSHLVTSTMIRKNLINCKLIRIKSSSDSLFESCMRKFIPGREVCPSCGCKGSCHVHAYYDRFIVDFVKGRPVFSRIRITRVICTCGRTHAILPDPIIPYASYSLFFILRVLAEYFLHLKTVVCLCDTFLITPSMLYRWKKLFLEHRREWCGLLASLEQDIRKSLKALILKDPFSSFAASFFQRTELTFLQSHRNPAPLRRKVPAPPP